MIIVALCKHIWKNINLCIDLCIKTPGKQLETQITVLHKRGELLCAQTWHVYYNNNKN